MACCSAPSHPNDWFCTWIYQLTKCPGGQGGDDAFSVLFVKYQEILAKLEQQNLTPPATLMLGLADLFLMRGDYAEALKTAKWAEPQVTELTFLSRVYHIQGDAYHGLSLTQDAQTAANKEHARAALALAQKLLQATQLKNDLG